MPTRVLEHCIIGVLALCGVFWLDLVPEHWLGRILKLAVLWAAFSTLLVAAVGAWIAYGKTRREGVPARQRITQPR